MGVCSSTQSSLRTGDAIIVKKQWARNLPVNLKGIITRLHPTVAGKQTADVAWDNGITHYRSGLNRSYVSPLKKMGNGVWRDEVADRYYAETELKDIADRSRVGPAPARATPGGPSPNRPNQGAGGGILGGYALGDVVYNQCTTLKDNHGIKVKYGEWGLVQGGSRAQLTVVFGDSSQPVIIQMGHLQHLSRAEPPPRAEPSAPPAPSAPGQPRAEALELPNGGSLARSMSSVIREKDEQLEELEDTLLCPLCSDNQKNAVVLPCRHMVCESCCKQWFEKEHKTTCPVCRGKTPRNPKYIKVFL